jgi:replicative DNA helicase
MLALQAGRTALQPQRISALLPEFIDRLQQRSEGKDDAVATGLADVDRLLGGGFRGGELVVIGARPSMGKSALSLAFARSMSSGGVVLVLSMEDSALMLVARQIAASGRINLADIRTPARAPQSMWERVPEAVLARSGSSPDEYSSVPLQIAETMAEGPLYEASRRANALREGGR